MCVHCYAHTCVRRLKILFMQIAEADLEIKKGGFRYACSL